MARLFGKRKVVGDLMSYLKKTLQTKYVEQMAKAGDVKIVNGEI